MNGTYRRLTDQELYALARTLREGWHALDRVSYRFNSLAAWDLYKELHALALEAETEIRNRLFIAFANSTLGA